MRSSILGVLALGALLLQSCDSSIACQEQFCVEKTKKQFSLTDRELSDLTCDEILVADPSLLDLPPHYGLFQTPNVLLISHCGMGYSNPLFANQLQTCYSHVQSFLGIQPLTQCILHTHSLDDDLSVIERRYFGDSPTGAAQCLMIRGMVGGNLSNQECNTQVEIKESERCAYGHEVTHSFVAGTLLDQSTWLNEGLADFVSLTLQGSIIHCNDNGYEVVSSEGVIESGEYVDLRRSRDFFTKVGKVENAYLTGACIWQTIADNFGSDAFLKIMQRIEQSRFRCLDLEEEVLKPVIGSKGVSLLKKRFGEFD